MLIEHRTRHKDPGYYWLEDQTARLEPMKNRIPGGQDPTGVVYIFHVILKIRPTTCLNTIK